MREMRRIQIKFRSDVSGYVLQLDYTVCVARFLIIFEYKFRNLNHLNKSQTCTMELAAQLFNLKLKKHSSITNSQYAKEPATAFSHILLRAGHILRPYFFSAQRLIWNLNLNRRRIPNEGPHFFISLFFEETTRVSKWIWSSSSTISVHFRGEIVYFLETLHQNSYQSHQVNTHFISIEKYKSHWNFNFTIGCHMFILPIYWFGISDWFIWQ